MDVKILLCDILLTNFCHKANV